MKQLALFGGEPALSDPIISPNHIGAQEARAAWNVITKRPLSGFLGGQARGGEYVRALEDQWAAKFNVAYAIACNSATSGLLASCVACGVGPGTKIIVPCFTMSATAAVAKFLGAELIFGDCDADYFGLSEVVFPQPSMHKDIKAVIITNLFGHPAHLRASKRLCENNGHFLIEDNAQAIGAKEGDAYAGTIGDIGVFSLNVHKAIHAGEGGICCTNDGHLADRLRGLINHGELAGGAVGLNLRMTEYTAAIASEQLKKLDLITSINIEQANALSTVARRYPWLYPPLLRIHCSNVYYCWAAKIDPRALPRERFVAAMRAEGFPLNNGYVDPLYRLKAFGSQNHLCPVAERLHDEELVLFENTMHWLSSKQLGEFEDALRKVDHHIKRLRSY
jgi:dTDP-4-amino-4,6-dideoxygalactose transaminase